MNEFDSHKLKDGFPLVLGVLSVNNHIYDL